MEPNYTIKYTETKNVKIDTCELYRLDVNRISYRVGSISVMVAVFGIMLAKSNVLTLPMNEFVMFLVKFLGATIAVVGGAEIFRRIFGRKMANTAAHGDVDTLYMEYNEGKKKELKVRYDFFDEHFAIDTNSKVTEYSYGKVAKLIESEKMLGIIVKTDEGPKGIFALPKESFAEVNLDELKNFLAEKCSNAKKGVVSL